MVLTKQFDNAALEWRASLSIKQVLDVLMRSLRCYDEIATCLMWRTLSFGEVLEVVL